MAKVCNLLSCEYPCCIGQLRFIVAAISFFAVLIGYSHRAVLNIGITEMVAHKNSSGSVSTCPTPPGQGSAIIKDIGGGKVEWSEFEQNLVISSFFIGYTLLHIPAGICADYYGPRHILITGFAVSTVSTAIIPWVAVSFPWWVTFIVRIITGAGQGALFPCVTALLSRWIPPYERARVSAAVFAANSWGLIVGNMGTGMLIQSLENWPLAFYFWSAIGGLFIIFCICYGFSDPRTDPFMTDVEMEYLQDVMTFKQPMKVPFLRIMGDICTWGLIMAQLGHSTIIFTLSNNMPKYMNNVLGFNIKNNALVSFIFILQWVSSVMAGAIADYVVKKKNANVSWIRKIYTSVSNIGSAVFLILAGYANCDYVMALVWFGFGIFFKGIFFAGLKVSIIDITVNHSGFMMAVINGLASIAGFVCSSCIGKLVPDNSLEQWHIVYWGLGGCQVITIAFYLFTASSDRRQWDYLPGEEPPPKKKTKWYLELTPSDHEIRLQKDAEATEKKKTAAAAAKQKMKEELKRRSGSVVGRG